VNSPATLGAQLANVAIVVKGHGGRRHFRFRTLAGAETSVCSSCQGRDPAPRQGPFVSAGLLSADSLQCLRPTLRCDRGAEIAEEGGISGADASWTCAETNVEILFEISTGWPAD